jgi:microsomal dipeptidase-like Zn-dependent dipeptidase
MSRRATLSGFALAAALVGTYSARGEAQTVTGYVDTHTHLAAELAFGGGWFWGTLEGPRQQAVGRCDGNLDKSHGATMFPIVSEIIGADTGWHFGKRNGEDSRTCERFLGVRIPGTCPKADFADWPSWDTVAHQQTWEGWLSEAHQGGLRVLVVSLVESEFLCINTALQGRRFACDEMSSARRQAAYVHEFAARNASWLGIARTPGQARALVASGKLALVLAVEVTKLFPQGDFIAQLDELQALDVVSVQLTHHADNRFSGAAPIKETVDAADQIETLWKVWTVGTVTELTAINDVTCADVNTGALATCNGDNALNVRGLTDEGRDLVTAMMDRGMLLDVAHVSRKAMRETYEMAHQRGDYPIFSSHAHMWDTIAEGHKHEKYLKPDELQMIASTGGMVGLRPGPEATYQYFDAQGNAAVNNRCQGTSRSFAQSLMYAVDGGVNVGFGADFNGFIKQLRPRNRLVNCVADVIDIEQQVGGATDLQNRGLGHIGMLPQLVDDLQAVGLPQTYLDHLNGSAEAFLQMWERSLFVGTGDDGGGGDGGEIDEGAFDVGVLPGAGGCPPESIEAVGITMDSEDNNPETSCNGDYCGGAEIFGNKNLTLNFCRVKGANFYSLAPTNDASTNYAVLKLGQTCPNGSVEFWRHFDNEDDDNANGHYGDVAPNTWHKNARLYFCLFAGRWLHGTSLPTLGADYGVFAGQGFGPGVEFGHIFSDDEDHNNQNDYSISASSYGVAAKQIIHPTDHNSVLNMARVTP